MERVEKIQYEATLAITGTWQGTSRNKLYDELGKVLVETNSMTNLVGKVSLIGDGVGAL